MYTHTAKLKTLSTVPDQAQGCHPGQGECVGQVKVGPFATSGVFVVILVTAFAHQSRQDSRIVHCLALQGFGNGMKFQVEEACDQSTQEHRQQNTPQHAPVSARVFHEQTQRDGEDGVYFLHEQHFGSAQSGGNQGKIRAIILGVDHPPDETVPEPVLHNRVGIFNRVAVFVVAGVQSRPPQWPPLKCECRDNGENELHTPACGKSLMGKIAVQADGHGNSNQECCDGQE